MEKSAFIQKARQLGFEYEKDKRGCCQSVIAALQDTLDMRNDDIFRAGSALSAGIGRCTDGACGAYSGVVMVIGQLFGRTRGDFSTSKAMNPAFHLAACLHERFIKEFGTVTCREIHQVKFGRTFDMWNSDDMKTFDALGAHTEVCAGVCANAAGWAMELILEENEKMVAGASGLTPDS